MKDYQGFKNNGNWYKGNLHSHTTVSDGKMTPEQSVEVYKEHGYNFLALSEHDIYTDYRKQYNTDNFIMIPAIEASAILYQEEGSSKRLEIHHLHGILGTSEMQKNAKAPLFTHMEHVPRLCGNIQSSDLEPRDRRRVYLYGRRTGTGDFQLQHGPGV